jgi:hypothetical protein
MASKKPKAAAHKNVPTPDQIRAREEMRTLSAAWNDLTDEQREAWGVKARTNRRGGRRARARRRSGRRLFFKANFRRLALKQALLSDPAGQESIHPPPLMRLVITNRAGRIVLKLHLAYGRTEGVMVSSWHPCNAGAMVWKKFVRIGLLPAAVRGVIDITRLYVAKFGVPPVGKKIFIRLQQMNDYLGHMVYTTSAIVPAEEEWHSVEKPPQTIANTWRNLSKNQAGGIVMSRGSGVHKPSLLSSVSSAIWNGCTSEAGGR